MPRLENSLLDPPLDLTDYVRGLSETWSQSDGFTVELNLNVSAAVTRALQGSTEAIKELTDASEVRMSVQLIPQRSVFVQLAFATAIPHVGITKFYDYLRVLLRLEAPRRTGSTFDTLVIDDPYTSQPVSRHKLEKWMLEKL